MLPTRTTEGDGACGGKEVASGPNRSNGKQLTQGGGFLLAAIAALVIPVWGPRALAEEEPAARALLPPPLHGVPAEGRPMPVLSRGGGQSDPHPSTTRFAKPKPQSLQNKSSLHSAPRRDTSVAKKQKAPARFGSRPTVADARRQSQLRGGSGTGPRSGPWIGELSPSNDYSTPQAEATPRPPSKPLQAPPLYYPDYFVGSPAYGYAQRYPYAWAPPGPGVLR